MIRKIIKFMSEINHVLDELSEEGFDILVLAIQSSFIISW